MAKMTVIIPVYNEEKAIGQTINELLPFVEEKEWQLIVVNDGSEDGTAEILHGFSPRLRIIQHPFNRGYGASLKHLQVFCKDAGPDSLHIEIVADFAGEAAPDYDILKRVLFRVGVDICNRHGWNVPFRQIRVHMPEGKV